MDPRTGDLIPTDELAKLRESDPVKAERYSVELTGPEHEVRSIAQAVKDAVTAEDIAKADSPTTKMLLAMAATGKRVYEGTVAPATIARRRAKNKASRRARRANR